MSCSGINLNARASSQLRFLNFPFSGLFLGGLADRVKDKIYVLKEPLRVRGPEITIP